MPKLYTLDPQKETHAKLGFVMCAGIIRYLRKVIQENPDDYQKSVLNSPMNSFQISCLL